MKPKVFFTRYISPENMLKMYKRLGVPLKGKIAVKVHTGEVGNQNFIPAEFFRPLVFYVTGTVCEANTAYPLSERNTTEKHAQTINRHGWTKYFKVDILDAYDDQVAIDIPNGKVLKQNIVGSHLFDYDSMIVVSHFKGHECSGFGGALKQLSIGCASRAGKVNIHSAGKSIDLSTFMETLTKDQPALIDGMAEAATSVAKLFEGRAVYINIAANISRDCDCAQKAENPCMEDIGIFASTDPVAIDKACLDAVQSSTDKGKDYFMERVNGLMGPRIFDTAEALGCGFKDYELVCLD